MIRRIKKGAFYLLFVLDSWVYIKKIPLLNKFKPGIGLGRLVRRVLFYPKKIINLLLVGGIYFETNIYGTKINMIDYGKRFDYYTHVSRGKIYEPALALQLKTLLKKYDSPTFIDIGAHYDYFTIYAGKLIGPRGHVISIEPHKKYYNRLLKNIQINGLKENIRKFNLALSDKEGQANMEGWDERVLHEVGNGNVQVVTFDQLCKKENIRPDIIKIDVHGAEGKVLAGMSDTLKNKVSHLFCELHDDMLGYTINNIIQILETAGLEVLEFTKHREVSGGKLVPISSDLLSHYDDRMLYARR
jgi:FkbM family methyltransferase